MEMIESILILLKDCGATIIAAISLLISIISLIKSTKAQRLQNKINELELIIKKNEIEKLKSEKENALLSCVEAKVINISQGKYKMKIWNSGSTKVTDVTVKTEPQVILFTDGIIPFDELEPKKSFELHMLVHNGTSKKLYVTTSWIDEEGVEKSKRQLVSY